MNKYSFMATSISLLVLFTFMASTFPEDFQRTTGINTEDINKLDFSEFERENVIEDRTCSSIEILDSRNIDESISDVESNITKTANTSVGWFTLSFEDVEVYVVDANSPGFFQNSKWIRALNYEGVSDAQGVEVLEFIIGDGNRVYRDSSDYVDQMDRVNISIYSDDASIERITTKCLLEKSDSGSFGNPLIAAAGSAVSDFLYQIGVFLGIILSILETFVALLSAGGNSISVLIKDVFVVLNIVGWVYISSDFIKDIIPFT